MEKIERFNFATKKNIMISVNNCLIDGTFNEKNINYFDKVFYKVSLEEFDFDIFLYNLWLEIKINVRRYYEKNKEKLKELLLFINMNLSSITNNIDINKVLIKIRDEDYE